LAGVLAGLFLGRRGAHDSLAPKPKDWPINFAHRGGAGIAPENTIEGFREMTLAEIKRLDAGYRFSTDGGRTFPHRGEGVRVATLEEVYDEFIEKPINVEIKGERPGVERPSGGLSRRQGPRSARSWSPKVCRPYAAFARLVGDGGRQHLRAWS